VNDELMKDRIVMVTGATAGIGKVTALEIARLGATVIAVGRDEAKGRDVVAMIKRQTGNPNVDYLLADLSSIEQTKALAEHYRATHDRLHVLVNNVGAIFMARSESVDGIENTFALNHLVGYFLLTNLLLDVIKASAPARIVNVSSRAHFQAQMDFEDLELREGYSGFKAYSNSKLANLLFTYELARRLEGTGLTANALHPGMAATNFGVTNNSGPLWRIMRRVLNLFAISEAEGAQTSIYLATSPEVEGVSGKYYEKSRPERSSEASYNEADQKRLWEISERMLGLKFTEATQGG
jgi:NAD(P)-dependent dehydrogenase (short-subunit alcohol dehydrogenase family)